jgi:hypothetical protein
MIYWAYLGEHNKQFPCFSFLLVWFSFFVVVVAMQKNATKENMMMCMIIDNL